MITTLLWAKMHGATTHFPFALVVCAAGFDTAALLLPGRRWTSELQFAGYWAIVIAAIGSIGAVASGIVMTRGSIIGHGMLRLHHLFAWPAFALLIALATWRVAVGRQTTRRWMTLYVIALVVAAAFVAAAAYWGGELMLRG